jgi:hypothetical protein
LSYLELEGVDAAVHELVAEPDDLLLGVAEPAGGRGVGGEALQQGLIKSSY